MHLDLLKKRERLQHQNFVFSKSIGLYSISRTGVCYSLFHAANYFFFLLCQYLWLEVGYSVSCYTLFL